MIIAKIRNNNIFQMDPLKEQIDQLRTRGYRITPQRMALLEIMHHASGHMQPAEIYQLAVNKIPGINEATVYRTLEMFAREGVIHRCYHDGSQIVYELTGQHHHLICRGCGSEISFDHQLLSGAYAVIEDRTGFILDTNHVIIHGMCPVCQREAPADQIPTKGRT